MPDNLVEGVKFHLFGTSLSGDAVDQYAVTDKDGVATFKDVLISGSEPYKYKGHSRCTWTFRYFNYTEHLC